MKYGLAHRRSGFTLVETTIVLCLAAILLAIGIPYLVSFRDKTVVSAQVHDFASALRRARREAMTRSELVSVCAVDPATADSTEPGCLAGGLDWSAGWLVFVDRGRRGIVSGGDRVVAVYVAGAGRGVVLGTLQHLSYGAGGTMLSLASHFRFLPPGQPPVDAPVPGSARVCVNKPGRPRLAKGGHCDG